MSPILRLRAVLTAATLFLTMAGSPSLLATDPVEFVFRPTATEGNPFSRDLWATIETPSERQIRLPAFYRGDGRWAVRARAAERGNYRFIEVTELVDGLNRSVSTNLTPKDRVRVRDEDPLGPAIQVDPRTGTTFVDGRGRFFQPLGGNLPWADGAAPRDYYSRALREFADAGLNWTRIWMSHWGQLNLDWVEPANGEQPELGSLSLEVADRIDHIIAAADQNGVRVQLVLQHHGQYTTVTNSNWDENPWNAALGGFLATPEDFFSDPQARQLTRDKFRYIVARWGYSSAIMAWELFNEVMWTNARRGDADANAAVAAWHTEMARHLRRYDVHGHLVTTSDDDLSHAMWATMDFYQPHLYANDMVLGVQSSSLPVEQRDRPLFYGEMGDDNMAGLSADQRTTGFVHPLLAWSGLFGEPTQPAQMWYVETLRQNDRWSEVVSLANFARRSGLLTTPMPRLVHPTVLGDRESTLTLIGGHYWHRGPNPELHLPNDGRVLPEWIEFRRIYDSATKPDTRFPTRAKLHLHYPAAAVGRVHLNRVANDGGSLRVLVDGDPVVLRKWPAATAAAPAVTDQTYAFQIGYGSHVIEIENPFGPNWIDLQSFDTGIPVPALVAVARQGRDRMALWVHHRDNLLSAASDEELSPATGTVQMPDVPAGRWTVTWWDPAAGTTIGSSTLRHEGGTLSLETPPILRHAAAWLQPAEE